MFNKQIQLISNFQLTVSVSYQAVKTIIKNMAACKSCRVQSMIRFRNGIYLEKYISKPNFKYTK